MNDLEGRLRTAYQAVAQRTIVASEQDAGTDLRNAVGTGPARKLTAIDGNGDGNGNGDGTDGGRAGVPRRRLRRPTTIQLAAAVLVVVAGAAAVVVASSSEGDKTTDPSVETGDPNGAIFPEAPIPGRFAHTAVWTGDEMVVFGGAGDDDESTETPAEGAAAYDPAARAWREIAAPPIRVSGWSQAVWTGREIVAVPYFYGSQDQTEQVDQGTVPTAAAYDPDTDEWTVLDGPGVCWVNQDCWVAWTGDRVVIAGLSESAGGGGWYDNDLVVTYDPESGTWDELPASPLTLDRTGSATWTGDELVYVGPDIALGADPWDIGRNVVNATRLAAVALDPSTGTWRTLPAPDLPLRENILVAWTGTEVVVTGGEHQTEDGSSTVYTDGATLDPATGTWTAVPPAPAQPFSGEVVVAGRLVVTGTDDPEVRPLVLDPEARTWSFGPADPRPDVQSGSAVAAGDQVLIWGGHSDDPAAPAVSAEGYAFTLPPAG
jgi:hypothetical protein